MAARHGGDWHADGHHGRLAGLAAPAVRGDDDAIGPIEAGRDLPACVTDRPVARPWSCSRVRPTSWHCRAPRRFTFPGPEAIPGAHLPVQVAGRNLCVSGLSESLERTSSPGVNLPFGQAADTARGPGRTGRQGGQLILGRSGSARLTVVLASALRSGGRIAPVVVTGRCVGLRSGPRQYSPEGWRGTSFRRRSPRSDWPKRGHAARRRCRRNGPDPPPSNGRTPGFRVRSPGYAGGPTSVVSGWEAV
jgi:hypothetical protein